MLISGEMLSRIGAEVFRIDRGGDITYHGPGQLVCYPIICLEDFKLGLKSYLHLLEEAVIRTCSHYGIKSGRVDGATGVWIDIGTPRERKICAMGVREQPFRDNARSGAEREYRPEILRLYQSVWLYPTRE